MTREEAIKLIETVAEKAGINVTVIDADNKKYEFKEGDKHYYISQFGDAQPSEWRNSSVDKSRFDCGNIYRTKEEAEKASRNIRVWNRLRMFAEEVNEGWKPDWKNSYERKWFITFTYQGQCWIATNRINCEDFCTIYFKTKEHAEQAIKEIVIPILGEAKEKE